MKYDQTTNIHAPPQAINDQLMIKIKIYIESTQNTNVKHKKREKGVYNQTRDKFFKIHSNISNKDNLKSVPSSKNIQIEYVKKLHGMKFL